MNGVGAEYITVLIYSENKVKKITKQFFEKSKKVKQKPLLAGVAFFKEERAIKMWVACETKMILSFIKCMSKMICKLHLVIYVIFLNRCQSSFITFPIAFLNSSFLGDDINFYLYDEFINIRFVDLLI